MGRLEEVLAAVDNARRVVGRNASDLFSDPAGHLTKITDALRNTNASVAPVISNGELTKRPLSPSEQTEQTLNSLDFGGGLGVIKPKGGSWLSGQVENALRGLKRGGDVALDGPVRPEIEALNQWVEGPLTKYVKRDMASPNDPIRALADQGILHVAPEQLPFQDRSVGLQRTRQEVGTPVEGIAQTPLGQSWENTADRFIAQAPADYYKYVPEQLQRDPWLANIPSETPIYDVMGSRGNELGFNHLVDELSNSLREGRLRPEQLQSGNFSVEAAVRHVAEINALRAKKAEEALQADMAGMPLHKDYPEQGYSWRQLQHENEDQLQKWLTQEGDAMGHCVGGYCPDVKSGASNIFSLRDAKGRPHVTIETAPPDVSAEQLNLATNLAHEAAIAKGLKPDSDAYFDYITDVEYDMLAKARKMLPADTREATRIVQIKGKGNAAPNAKYLPFVQDFIKSGKWSEISDAENTGLSPAEINQLLGR